MLIRMRTTYAGPAGTCAAGAEISLPDDVATALIKSGNAEKVSRRPKPKPLRRRRHQNGPMRHHHAVGSQRSMNDALVHEFHQMWGEIYGRTLYNL